MQYPHIKGMLIKDLRILAEEIKLVISERTPTIRAKRFLKENKPANISQDNNLEIIKYNSSSYLIPIHHLAKKKLNAAAIYLPALLNQDWSHLFSGYGYSEERKFYVYAHVNPEMPNFRSPDIVGGAYNGTPFYIGKGSEERAFDLKRNQGHGKVLNQLNKLGYKKDSIVKIIKSELNEAEAFELESKLIFFFGTIYNKKRGVLYNLDTPKTPKFCGMMKRMDLSFYHKQGVVIGSHTCDLEIA